MAQTDWREILRRHDLPLHGAIPFGAVAGRLLPCRAAARLGDIASRSVIVTVFPYRFPDGDEDAADLSRYARVPDYHAAAGEVLARAAGDMAAAYPPHTFLPFLDNSPIPEVPAAAAAGLGVVGRHGLLITGEYGSWVFIGTIVTDLALEASAGPVRSCPGCGCCADACPGNCLRKDGEKSTHCLSAISQKKGELSAEETALLRKGRFVWGCDICQEACLLNAGTRAAPHPCFADGYEPSLTPAQLENPAGRAYAWRGRTVLERNLRIMESQD